MTLLFLFLRGGICNKGCSVVTKLHDCVRVMLNQITGYALNNVVPFNIQLGNTFCSSADFLHLKPGSYAYTGVCSFLFLDLRFCNRHTIIFNLMLGWLALRWISYLWQDWTTTALCHKAGCQSMDALAYECSFTSSVAYKFISYSIGTCKPTLRLQGAAWFVVWEVVHTTMLKCEHTFTLHNHDPFLNTSEVRIRSAAVFDRNCALLGA